MRFIDNKDGTITENQTGLIWLKNADAFGARNWKQALALANALCSGTAGLTDGSKVGDWRLPNIKELKNLLNFEYTNTALIDTFKNKQSPECLPFIGIQSNGYWSSTTYSNYTSCAWLMYLYDYYEYYDYKTNLYYVWPVRTKNV